MPSVALGFLVAFFPKCPVCWAAYMSAFGVFGATGIPYMAWMFPVLATMLGIHLLISFRRCHRTGYGPFVLNLAGAIVILAGRYYAPLTGWILMTGILLIAAGSLWATLSANRQLSPNQH